MPFRFVVPARAGVILDLKRKEWTAYSGSRASGGDPSRAIAAFASVLWFPRERG